MPGKEMARRAASTVVSLDGLHERKSMVTHTLEPRLTAAQGLSLTARAQSACSVQWAAY